MKLTSMTIFTALLLQILAPGLSVATEQRQRDRTSAVVARVSSPASSRDGRKQQESQDKGTGEIAVRAVEQFLEKDVAVMSRGKLDLTKLKRGRYAHVVYISKGVKITSTGVITEKSPEGIVVKSAVGFVERRQIEYRNIDTVVVAKDRRALERWQARLDGRFFVMSQGALELPKIKQGWYAHVTYTSNGNNNTATGEIIHADHRGILIKSSDLRDNSSGWGKELEIEYGDIETVAVAENRMMIQSWKRAMQPLIKGTPMRVTNKLTYGALGGFLGAGAGAILIGSIGMGLTENTCHLPEMRGEICIEGEAALGLSLGYLLGVSAVSAADPNDRYLHSLAGSVAGGGAGIVMTMLNNDLWPSLLLGPLVGATIASERSRRPPDAPRFSVGLLPGNDSSLTAVATLRF